MILARKDGWLIAVRVLRKTRSGAYVQPVDSARQFFVSASDCRSKLCSDVAEAMAFATSKGER